MRSPIRLHDWQPKRELPDLCHECYALNASDPLNEATVRQSGHGYSVYYMMQDAPKEFICRKNYPIVYPPKWRGEE